MSHITKPNVLSEMSEFPLFTHTIHTGPLIPPIDDANVILCDFLHEFDK